GGLSFVFLGSDTVANIIWGPMGDRLGFRIVYIGSLLCSIAGVVTLMMAGTATPIYASFILLGFGTSGWMLAASTMVLEFGSQEDIPMRLGLVTTVEGIIAAIGPVLAGVAIALVGFEPFFATVLIALTVAVALIFFTVREPRDFSW
ncbi:MAG: MFS transporter, partial [Sphingorhabdus sp.]|nr:MFS transporter [Sphingorhabdus sp.]